MTAPIELSRLLEIVRGFLDYSFRDIKWDWNLLTETEQQICTPEEFEVLKKLYGNKEG